MAASTYLHLSQVRLAHCMALEAVLVTALLLTHLHDVGDGWVSYEREGKNERKGSAVVVGDMTIWRTH